MVHEREADPSDPALHRLHPASHFPLDLLRSPLLQLIHTPPQSTPQTLPSESLWDSADGAAAFGVSAGASTGEVSAIILLKLVMDNYLKAGGRGAYAPTLLLLQRALSSGRPAAQARVFDLLYNLSLHGELLYLSPAAEVPETAAAIRQSGADRAGLAGWRGGGGGFPSTPADWDWCLFWRRRWLADLPFQQRRPAPLQHSPSCGLCAA